MDYIVVIKVIDELSEDTYDDSYSNPDDGFEISHQGDLLKLFFSDDWESHNGSQLLNHNSVQIKDLFSNGCDECTLVWERDSLTVQCKITDSKQRKRNEFLDALRTPERLSELNMSQDVKAQMALMQGCVSNSYSSHVHDWIINQL